MPRRPNLSTLSDDDRRQLHNWLAEKGCKCPACGAVEWGEPGDGSLRYYSGAGRPDFIPAILVPCARCGYLAFFDPFTTGITTETT